MTKILSIIFSPILGALAKLFPFFMTYKAGKDSEKRKNLKKENEILKKQNRNRITNSKSARMFWKKFRK